MKRILLGNTGYKVFRMNLDFIPIYQFHDISNPGILDTVMAKGGALETLKKIKEEGHIGAIGITGHRADEDLYQMWAMRITVSI